MNSEKENNLNMKIIDQVRRKDLWWTVKVLLALFTLYSSLFTSRVAAQDVIVNPDISYAGTPRSCEIGGLAVEGVDGYEDYVLTGLSGLSVGQQIEVPGQEIMFFLCCVGGQGQQGAANG